MLVNWSILVCIFLCCCVHRFCDASCPNDCNNHGRCSLQSICQCNTGWTGADCSLRMCPSGFLFSAISNQTDNAHMLGECSGRGRCDRESGICVCDKGFGGPICQKVDCFNGCSGHGNCMTLKEAASFNDGYNFDRSTTYTRWDANSMQGCQCDPGWGAPDCSQRMCPWGPDPRAGTTPYEFITLVCTCSSTCSGKFKLQYLGSPVKQWFKPTTYGYEIANALMAVPGVLGNSSTYSQPTIIAYSGDVNDTNVQICASSTTRRTKIRVLRTTVPPVPKISFYANAFSSGSIYFETKQILTCDCTDRGCNGTFRVAFDGQVSARLHTWKNASSVVQQLNAMATVAAAGITVSAYDSTDKTICSPGEASNYTLVMTGAMGNSPRVEIISSVVNEQNPSTFNTLNSTGGLLRILTPDGRDDFLKLCNGIGTCNVQTGLCECPWGWKADPFWGPCGREDANSSTWQGMTRCPGLVETYMDFKGVPPTFDYKTNYRGRFYMSFDASNYKPWSPWFNTSRSFIGFMPMQRQNPYLTVTSANNMPVVLVNMSSNHSAGPLLVDEVNGNLFFFDLHFAAPFIGKVPLDVAGPTMLATDYVWLRLTYNKINAFTMDAHWKYRKIYWTVSGTPSVADGAIYWAYMDTATGTAYNLATTIGQAYVIDPTGIAVHYWEEKIYWLDKVSTSSGHTRLLKCQRDGSGVTVVHTYTSTIDNFTPSGNSSELYIDFRHNNTAFFMDLGNGTKGDRAIIATNLGFPQYVNNSNVTDMFKYMRSTWIVAYDDDVSMGEPRSRPRLYMDDNTTTLYFTDPVERQMNFVRYQGDVDYMGYVTNLIYNANGTDIGRSYQVPRMRNQPGIPYYPVGMAIDRGLGAPTLDDYHDCFGNGVCGGAAGNWTCACNEGFMGNCAKRSCPKGLAWFHEPLVDEIAHDVEVECSNMGICDRDTGYCICREGYQGNACERMGCPVFPNYEEDPTTLLGISSACASVGRCMSVRELATYHKDYQLATDPLVYGTHPLNKNTWDADRIFGCLADEYGYFLGGNFTSGVPGHMVCPFGYDMRYMDIHARNKSLANYSNYMEVQQMDCKGDSGYFTVTFRGKTSEKIYAYYDTYQMAQILSAVPTIGPVRISVSTGGSTDPVCSTSNYLTIYMYSVLGDAPLLSTDFSSLKWRSRAGLITVRSIQTGSSRGLLECSGHGNCNRITGECECFDNWVSSDGFGEPGPRGDCGATSII